MAEGSPAFVDLCQDIVAKVEAPVSLVPGGELPIESGSEGSAHLVRHLSILCGDGGIGRVPKPSVAGVR